ncbi:MAG: hypothetical protein H6559_15850 [Lewinellaceae bacterium]|nr:hypothetical protein [Lewinellaceae bacterium]
MVFKTDSDPPLSVTAMPSSVCAGEPVQLTASGGDAGTGADLYWYSDPNDTGSFLGKGSSITQLPTMDSTRYHVRREGDCDTTDFRSVLVRVKETPQPFESITVAPPQPCIGNPVTLTAIGGANQSDDDVAVWYDSPNGTEIDQGDSITIASAENKTYYVRRENGCTDGNSSYISRAVTTLPAPVATIEMPVEVTCKDETVTFQAIENPIIIDYQWTFTGATPSSHNGPGPVDVEFGNVGQSIVTLIVDNGSCTNTLKDTIAVLDQPDIFLDDVPLTNSIETFTITEKLVTTLILSSNLPEGAFSWSCEEDDPGSLAGGAGSGTDSLVRHNWVLADKAEEAALTCMATVTQGNCENMAEFKILVKRLIFVPNVLTANGDEFNQCWEIELGPDIQFDPTDFEIELYSRGGECVRGCQETFTVADAVEMCGEDCPGAGAYWYVIKGPEGFSATGALTIIK